ncbi:hypothetical protein [Streptomyces spectabilis]|uniref:Secreted protein n=1 Tax=Streptomyces spectabilis TaxID=68270 RepID=A0A5P2XI41_STRST|nr:hypothetical protein [Streptomyces spectabilis]MBB5102423.1 hypothetical protein [Streptomyces spectabilis]MCI3907465.1 hypothetical protein [Streptomyces spectabilis]QEV64168.1 hypothetical protein CP982_40325 [Streptomyces spectabilis]GGV31911.1 hypothetical protein GCM10010245_51810 [Streptomyces spectabilis]
MSGREVRIRRGAWRTGALCLLAFVVCMLTAFGSGAASASSAPEKAERTRATAPYGSAVEVSVGPDTSGCQDGDGQDTPRSAALPRPDQPCASAPRPAPTSGDAAPVAATWRPTGPADATAVDLYRTCVIRT